MRAAKALATARGGSATHAPMPKLVSEALAAFIELEEAQDLWSLELFGKRYYHAIRAETFDAVAGGLGLLDARHQRRPYRYLRSLAEQPRRLSPIIRGYAWRALPKTDLLVVNHPRHQLLDGVWQCPYTAPLLRGYPGSFVVLERSDKGHHWQPAEMRGLHYLDGACAVANAAFVIQQGAQQRLHESRIRAHAKSITSALSQGLGLDVAHESVARLIRRELRHLTAYTTMYERLLDQAQPRAVLCVVHYSARCIPLTLAARRRGIPVIEVQHGTIGAGHAAYNVAKGRTPTAFPDYLLTFGDYWRETTKGLPLSAEQAPAIGYAWLEMLRERALSQASRTRRTEKKVLFVSQSAIGSALSRVAAELAPLASTHGYVVEYKLHPGETSGWRERMPWLVRDDIRVIDTQTSIYHHFAEASVQVGVYSTALYEGLAFGLPTVIMALPGWDNLAPLVDAGAARVAVDARELWALLQDAAPQAPSELLERVFRPRAVHNFGKFISQLQTSHGR